MNSESGGEPNGNDGNSAGLMNKRLLCWADIVPSFYPRCFVMRETVARLICCCPPLGDAGTASSRFTPFSSPCHGAASASGAGKVGIEAEYSDSPSVVYGGVL